MSDPVSAFIAFVVKVGVAVAHYWAAASTLTKAVIVAAALITVTATATALMRKPSALNQGQELQLKLDPTMPRQVLVGTTATGGSLVWSFTWTDDGGAPNRYLVRIIALSDRPCDGLVNVLEGNDILSFSGDPTTGEVACNQHLSKDGDVRMWLRVYLGSDTPTADANLITWTSTFPAGEKWTTNHKGTGLCYAIVRYWYDTDAFPNGEPQLTFVMKGAHVYDDRKDVSLGGTQQLADPTTWAYSENASVLTAQLLRGFYTNGSLLLGAQADSRDLNTDMLIAAHNTCDQTVALAAGGTEKRYTAHMLLTASSAVQDMLQDLQAAMDGKIIDRGGGITIWPGATRTPILDLDDSDIDWSEEKSYQPFSLSTLYNIVRGQYVPKAQNYVQEDYPTQTDASYVTADGGQKITLNVDFKAVTSDATVQRITHRMLLASRFQRNVGWVGPLWLAELEQGDWFTLTSSRWNFTTKYFEVSEITITQDLKIQLVATETSSTIDGWSTANEVARTSTAGPRGTYGLAVPAFTLGPYVASGADGSSIPALEWALTLALGTPAFHIEVQYKKHADIDWLPLPMFPSEATSGVISNLLPGTSYDVQMRSTDGIHHSAWSTTITQTTPADWVVNGIAGPSGVKLDWTALANSLAPIGQNAIVNSEFLAGGDPPTGWITGLNNTGLTLTSSIRSSNGFNVAKGVIAGTPANTTQFDAYTQDSANRSKYLTPVLPNDWVAMSARAAYQNCAGVDLYVVWYDINGTVLSSSKTTATGGANVNGDTVDPNSYGLITLVKQAPANARWAQLVVRALCNGSGINPTLWMMQPMLARLPAGASSSTAVPIYTPGPALRNSTVNIVTRSQSAPGSPNPGDIWVVLDTLNRITSWQTWNGTAWVQSGTNNNITRSQTAPTTPTIGDMWVKLDSNNNAVSQNVWNGTGWVTASTFNNIIIQSGTPSTTTNTTGDIWVQTSGSRVVGIFTLQSGSWVSTATTNIVTRSQSAPSSPTTGDIWVVLDTLNRVTGYSTWNGSVWVQSSSNNVFTQSQTAPSAPTLNDLWLKLNGSNVPIAIEIWNGTSWTVIADLTAQNTALNVQNQTTWATYPTSPNHGPSSWDPNYAVGQTQYFGFNGQAFDWRGLMNNAPIGWAGGRAAWNISSTSSSISVAGYTEYRTGSNITVPSGTVTGLTSDTIYDVFYFITNGTIIAVATSLSYLYMIDVSNYIYLGRQATQTAGGTYSSPPVVSSGRYGGGSGGGGTVYA